MAPADLGFVAALSSTPENLWCWRQRGLTYRPEDLAELLSNGALCQFIVQRRATGQPIGHVAAIGADQRNGHAHISVMFDGSAQAGSGWRLEGFVLFLNYVFQTFPVRKLYAEMPEFNLGRISSGEGRFFVEEGRLREHEYLAGRRWDLLILAIYRERFEELASGLLQRVVGRDPERGSPYE